MYCSRVNGSHETLLITQTLDNLNKKEQTGAMAIRRWVGCALLLLLIIVSNGGYYVYGGTVLWFDHMNGGKDIFVPSDVLRIVWTHLMRSAHLHAFPLINRHCNQIALLSIDGVEPGVYSLMRFDVKRLKTWMYASRMLRELNIGERTFMIAACMHNIPKQIVQLNGLHMDDVQSTAIACWFAFNLWEQKRHPAEFLHHAWPMDRPLTNQYEHLVKVIAVKLARMTINRIDNIWLGVCLKKEEKWNILRERLNDDYAERCIYEAF